jgi:Fur family ferric uptake transcriptional regulator
VEKQDLKQAGLKVTRPRMKILELLENTKKRHLTAEDVYKILLEQKSDIGLATVYRVLTQFETAGLITRHHFEGAQSVFELAQEEHHDHMICLKTGKIVEFYDEVIEQRQREIAEEHGFEITDHTMILYGRFK